VGASLLDPKLAERLTERLAHLGEAGRVLSSSNERAIRAAITALQAVLSKVGGQTTESAEPVADGAVSNDIPISAIEAVVTLANEAAAILLQDDSFDARRCAVQCALMQRYPWPPNYDDIGEIDMPARPWIRDIYDDVVVYQMGDDLYRCDYTINDDESITLGPPVEVEVAYVPAPDADDAALPTDSVTVSAEAEATPTVDDTRNLGGIVPIEGMQAEAAVIEGEIIPLIEKAVKKDGSMRIKLIQPGWGSSAYYPEAVLKRDGPKVFTKGLHMFWNHQTAEESASRPEGDLRDVAAVFTSDAAWEENGPAGKGLYADAKAIDGYRDSIESLAPHIGTSIRSWGRTTTGEAEGQKGPILQEFTAGQSVDFVTRAGAGGEIVQLFEAARYRPTPISDGGTTVADEMTAEQARVLREAMSGLETQLRESQATIARQNEALLLRDARDLISTVLAEAEMPDLTRKRLSEDLIKRPVVKDGALDRDTMTLQVREAVKAELTYLAQATGGTGQIKGMGSNGVISPQWQAQAEAGLADGLKRLGLSDAAASTAARGR
jgi:hypothetical protein